MSQTNLLYKGIHFDSDEEVFVAMWLQELKEKGLIRVWTRSKEAIPLTPIVKLSYDKTTKVKTEVKAFTVLRETEYTPDFEILWTMDGVHYLVTFLHATGATHLYHEPQLLFTPYYDKPMLLEVKPSFDQNNMEREFKLKQKYLWDKLKLFVNLVEPVELFRKTFLPLEAAPYFKYKKSPTGKNKGKKGPGDWKMDWTPKTINEFLNSN